MTQRVPRPVTDCECGCGGKDAHDEIEYTTGMGDGLRTRTLRPCLTLGCPCTEYRPRGIR